MRGSTSNVSLGEESCLCQTLETTFDRVLQSGVSEVFGTTGAIGVWVDRGHPRKTWCGKAEQTQRVSCNEPYLPVRRRRRGAQNSVRRANESYRY